MIVKIVGLTIIMLIIYWRKYQIDKQINQIDSNNRLVYFYNITIRILIIRHVISENIKYDYIKHMNNDYDISYNEVFHKPTWFKMFFGIYKNIYNQSLWDQINLLKPPFTLTTIELYTILQIYIKYKQLNTDLDKNDIEMLNFILDIFHPELGIFIKESKLPKLNKPID